MRRTLSIASLDFEPTLTKETLDSLARADPSQVLVFSTFENEPIVIGQCVGLWLSKRELWADLDISDDAFWPRADDPEPPHAESVLGFEGKKATLLCVVITSMPRGMVGPMFQSAFEVLKTMKKREN